MKAALYLFVCALTCVFSHPIEADQAEWTMVPTGDGHFRMINLEEAKVQASLRLWDIPILFNLYTRLNPTIHEMIIIGSPYSLINSRFNPMHPTRIIIHGWRNNYQSPVNTLIRDAYLARGDFNIIVVDWSEGAKLDYGEAKRYVDEVSHFVAEFIDFLDECGYPLMDNIYLIGHSLGAHVSGRAGRRAKHMIDTIFALDAALPLWVNDSNKVTSSDAKYVQSIHTDGGRLGYEFPIGVSSFYPNWLKTQPGCGYDVTGTCSHSRAYQYFAESLLLTNRFVGLKCWGYGNIVYEDCSGPETALMGGEPSNHNVKGVFYVPVNAAYPFATGKV